MSNRISRKKQATRLVCQVSKREAHRIVHEDFFTWQTAFFLNLSAERLIIILQFTIVKAFLELHLSVNFPNQKPNRGEVL